MNGLQKFYIGLWVAFLVISAALLITGNMTMMALTYLGFITFGLIFMGMMCVLPTTAVHTAIAKAAPANAAGKQTAIVAGVKSWLDPVGIEMKRPQLR